MIPSSSLNDKELTEVLHLIVNKIMKANPALKLDEKRKNELVEDMKAALTTGGHAVGKEDIKDQKFVNKLFMVVCMTLTAEKNKALLVPLKELFKKFESADPKNAPKLTPKDLRNKLTPQELQMALLLIQELRKKMKDNCKICKLPEPKASTPEDDMAYLLGVINKNVTGGHAVVVQRNPGNLMGIVDVSPNFESSMAPIDSANKLSDTGFGDPLGFNASARDNYKTSSVDETTMGEIRQVSGLTPGQKR